jgi:DNA-binding MarR family transcriptional regulator
MGRPELGARRKTTRASRKAREGESPGRYAYEGLDRIMHEKARLGIMTSLMTRPEGSLFGELKELCALTDGNLSRHLDVLHEAGLIEIWKGFEKKRPQTLCRLTADGRSRFLEYVEELERVVRDAQRREGRAGRKLRGAASRSPVGWVPV